MKVKEEVFLLLGEKENKFTLTLRESFTPTCEGGA